MTPNIKKLTSTEAYELGRKIGSGEGHDKSSPETRERLGKLEVTNTRLETNQKNIMQEIQELKIMIEKLGCKFDIAIEKKADKQTVNGLISDMEKLKIWLWKALGAIGAVLFILSFFKDQILGIFK